MKLIWFWKLYTFNNDHLACAPFATIVNFVKILTMIIFIVEIGLILKVDGLTKHN